MPTLLENEYLSITIDSDAPIVRTVRLEQPFASNEHYVEVHEEAVKLFAGLDRHRYGHMVDLRRAPMNNDPRFEDATRRTRTLLLQGFAHVVFVTRTAAGALQIARLARQGEINVPVFQDDTAAISFLKAAFSGGPHPPSGPAQTPPHRPSSPGRPSKIP
jgi:hypothetical protein